MSVLKKMSFAACVAVGVAVEFALTLVLLFPVAVLVNKQLLGEGSAVALPMVVAGASVFVAERLLAHVRKKQALVIGSSLASIFMLFSALLCALVGSECAFGSWLVWLGLSVFAGALLGAAVSIRKSIRRKHRRR